ncbi:MAG TPA: ABC transporter substrate-binding protein [Methanomassiliicoccales archaeon]|nr:ABC transporter substrate-binding protein [Methanomassiliicoccales archaeon]HNX47642.1 ABC transporter substrate-binding protein [Methanomassiliicoccales archaeon]HPR97929.1 ABC transporter substrate-binding protein [Methanomassiliicoccales archaeon]
MNKKMLAIVLVIVVVIAAVGVAILMMSSDDGEMDLTVAYSEKMNYETLMVANDKGYFDDVGLNVTPAIVTGGIQAAEAIVTGSADVAAMGDAPAVQLISKGIGAKIIGRIAGAEGMHRIISDSNLTEPEDLEGKKVGMQQSSSSHGAFLQWCKANEVDTDLVKFVYLNPTYLAEAMYSGQIDAMVGSEPWAINTENLCGDSVHELGSSSGLGSSFPIVLVASHKALTEKGEALSRLLEALDMANDHINGDWNDSMDICAAHTGLTVGNQSKGSGLQFFELGFNATDVQSLTMTAMGLMDFGKIDTVPIIMDHVDLSYLPEE